MAFLRSISIAAFTGLFVIAALVKGLEIATLMMSGMRDETGAVPARLP